MLNNPNEWHNLEEDGDFEQSSPNREIPKKKDKSSPLLLIILLLLLAGLGFFFIQNMAGSQRPVETKSDIVEEEIISDSNIGQDNNGDAVIDVSVEDGENNGELVIAGSEGSPQGHSNEVVVQQMPLNTTTIEKKTDQTVLVSVGGGGRANPFEPSIATARSSSGYSRASYGSVSNIPFEIIPPPSGVNYDSGAEEVMATTISGIMFDSIKPSAIINIKGQDQLVRKGDIISGFNIIDITKDKVVLKKGTNIFRASVGQTLSTEGININEVYNLKQRFGGTYSSVAKDSIEIKAN